MEIKGVRTVTVHNDTNERVVLDFNNFEDAARHFDDLYVNAVDENYAEEVLYQILLAAQNEEYDYIDEDGYAVIEVDATGIFDGIVTKVKTLKESEDDEDDFYEDVIELLDPSGIGQKKVLTDTYIKDILNDPTVEDSDKEKFKQILASEELLDEVFEAVTEALYDSVELSDYISDYSAHELSDMDGPWNTVMDIVNECLWDFVKRNLPEGHRTKGLKESYRRTTSRGYSLVDNDLFIDFE